MVANWYCSVVGVVTGPFDPIQIRELARSGRLGPDDFVKKGIAGEWVAAGRLEGVVFHAGQHESVKSSTQAENGTSMVNEASASVVKPKGNNRLVLVMVVLFFVGFVLAQSLSTSPTNSGHADPSSQTSDGTNRTSQNAGHDILKLLLYQAMSEDRAAKEQAARESSQPCSACGGSHFYSYVDGNGNLQRRSCPYCTILGVPRK